MKRNIPLYTEDVTQKLIVKLPGTACNISCDYCFEKGKKLDFIEAMSPLTLENSLNWIGQPIEIMLHGGEPLMIGKERFDSLLDLISRHKEQIRSVFLQTNGTLLDHEWLELLFNHYKHLNIEVAISLDGTAEMNKLRVTKDGKPTFESIIHAFKLLEGIGKKAGLLSVISKHALDFTESYVDMLLSIDNLRFVKINPLFDVIPGGLDRNSITPQEFTEFLKGVFLSYINRGGYRKFPIEPFLSLIQQIEGVGSKYCNYNQKKCLNFTTLYPDGKMSICDCFSIADFPIKTQDVDSFRVAIELLSYSEKVQELKKMMEECQKCDIWSLCQGGCLSQRWYFQKYAPELHEDYCLHRRELFGFTKELLC
ncbi:radical SAM protein [Heliobacterium chlorum]|uniref:Radical SAM protein n=1 Tax=Heliobacterium chlorum TaxID=2698 RepID=A0ABR7T279_HELCL|nr:radical SAM protein [Heliobacterium chlorum]MBC9784302.1 radical SAM protein [Heliobacterium chlorum]